MNSPISLVDIVNLEFEIANNILLSECYTALNNISLTCTVFNKIIAEYIKKIRDAKIETDNEYYKKYIPSKITNLIICKVLSLSTDIEWWHECKISICDACEYDIQIKKLLDKINISNRNIIFETMKMLYAMYESDLNDIEHIRKVYFYHDLDGDYVSFDYRILKPLCIEYDIILKSICIEYSSLILNYLI